MVGAAATETSFEKSETLRIFILLPHPALS
jgi:hypothetical protein